MSLTNGMVWYGILEFNVPLDTEIVIIRLAANTINNDEMQQA